MRKVLKATKAYKIYYDDTSKLFSLEMITTFFIDKNLTDSISPNKLEEYILRQTPEHANELLYYQASMDLIDCIKSYQNKSSVKPVSSLYDEEDDYAPIEAANPVEAAPTLNVIPSSGSLLPNPIAYISEVKFPPFNVKLKNDQEEESESFASLEDIEKAFIEDKPIGSMIYKVEKGADLI